MLFSDCVHGPLLKKIIVSLGRGLLSYMFVLCIILVFANICVSVCFCVHFK